MTESTWLKTDDGLVAIPCPHSAGLIHTHTGVAYCKVCYDAGKVSAKSGRMSDREMAAWVTGILFGLVITVGLFITGVL